MPEIVPGVWFYTGDFMTTGQANSIVIEMADHLVVVDANSPSGAKAVAAAARSLSSKPVKHVLLTHHHGDHIYGSALWTRAGAVTLAHESMTAELARIEPARWQGEIKRNPEAAELGPTPEPPRRTFSGETWVHEDRTRRLEVRRFGPAHTRDDVMVWLPKERVLCSGDTAIHTALNSFFDSDFLSWIAVLGKAAELKPRHVLPGHGRPGEADMLALQREYLTTLRDAALDGRKRGVSPEELARTLQFPDRLRPWVGAGLVRHLDQVGKLLPGTR